MLRKTMGFVALCMLAGCTTTAPIAGSQTIGYRNIDSRDGAQVYVCQTGSCGDLSVGVHKTETLTATQAAEFTTGINSTTAQRLAKIAIEQEGAARGQNVRVSRVRDAKIGAFDGAQIDLILRARDGDRVNAGMVILQNDRKAEVFVVIADSSQRARSQARRLATVWSNSQ
ncbi:MAG: hypothetical protein AAGI92_00110 [Pseudomonadota bacterium]